MQRKAFTFWEIAAVLAVVMVAAVLIAPLFLRARESHSGRTPETNCRSNLKLLGLGVIQYIQDFDEKYPPTQNAAGGWGTLIFPYVKSEQIFQCGRDQSGGARKTTDYFINARLANVSQGKMDAISSTLLMGDGTGDQPLNSNLSQLPPAWRTDENSPAWRHLGGANYGFADGHVKWVKPDKITLDKPALGKPTFLVK